MTAAPYQSAMQIAAGSTITDLLKTPPLPALEARILVMHALHLTRVQLITQSERVITESEAQQIAHLFQRRIAGEPIAYIVGMREFFGLPFCVTPDVLIPRPETELLVELAMERLPKNGRILDMGTGSGAIAIAIAHTRLDVHATALDASANALEIARQNATQNKVHVEFLHSDWYCALYNQRFDVIVSNPPYIAEGDTHLTQGDLRFEPPDALTDHADGLTALRTITAEATRFLLPGGWLLMEHGYDQAQAVRELCISANLQQVQSWQDLAGIERVSGGKFGT
jgi:release factor glutamine methyltransferase